jgi:predicted esterase
MTNCPRFLRFLCWFRSLWPGNIGRAVLCLSVLGVLAVVQGETITMQNGLQYEGLIGQVSGIGADPLDNGKIQRIFVIDNGLSRTYLSERLHISRVGGELPNWEIIKIPNHPAREGKRLASVGRILYAEPFDRYGRRRLMLSGANSSGQMPFVQAITEINPLYIKVEGIRGKNSAVSDMRIKTSSIPREILSQILMNYVDRKDPDDRLRVVRLYIQAERYRDARAELQKVISEFPELKDLNAQVNVLGQAMARRVIDEIEMRRDAGQHAIVDAIIRVFPTDGIANETLLKVRDIEREIQAQKDRCEKILVRLAKDAEGLTDPAQREVVAVVLEEIDVELNLNSVDRLVDYERLAGDKALTAQQKLALALTGWFLGPGNGEEDIAVATSLISVRDIVKKYLSTATVFEREDLIKQLNEEEGGAPKYVADLIAHLKLEPNLPEPVVPGMYERTVPPQRDLPSIKYTIQLPPGYDPYRRYPCILALHGGTSPKHPINWWAGPYSSTHQRRLGQASRHGYIVLAPEWTQPLMAGYEFLPQEHHAVLSSLRHAMSDFSIDSDRVFLTGYSKGANGAWDIALAHPDLWAGVILFSGDGHKYVTKYWQNAKGLPLYFIFGELDDSQLVDNAIHLDRYLNQSGFDCTVVEYLGRGHERFGDEIQRVFDWMGMPANRRDFARREFEMVAMRPFDNFFWWVEVDGYPSKSMVSPYAWASEGKRTNPASTRCIIKGVNRLEVRTVARHVRIGLTPDIVDFADGVKISVNGRRLRDELVGLEPNAETILEDVRTRGDRLHPFWAILETRGSRR